MSGPVSEQELQRALATIRAAGREDLLAGNVAEGDIRVQRRPQRAAAAGVAAAIMACESPSSGSERGNLMGGQKGGKGGLGGNKGKGPAKKQRVEERSDLEERTNRVLGALREERPRGQGAQAAVEVESEEEGEEELEEGEYAEGIEDFDDDLFLSEEEELVGEGTSQVVEERGQTDVTRNTPVFVVSQPAKEGPAGTVATVTREVTRPVVGRQAGDSGYGAGELKREVMTVWGEMLGEKQREWDEKFAKQWLTHEKENEARKARNAEICATQQKERAFMRNKSEELCKAMQGRLDEVEELCTGLKQKNELLERREKGEGGKEEGIKQRME